MAIANKDLITKVKIQVWATTSLSHKCCFFSEEEKTKTFLFGDWKFFFHPKTKASTAVSHTNVISVVSSSSSSNIFAHAVAELKHVSGIFKNRALKIFSTEKEKKN